MKKLYKIILSTLLLIVTTIIWLLYANYIANNSLLNLFSILIVLTLYLITISRLYISLKLKTRKSIKKKIITFIIIFIIIINIFVALTPNIINLINHKQLEETKLNTYEDIENKIIINDKLQKNAKKGLYSKLFSKEKIVDVNISIDRNNWTYLLENAIEKPTVMANSITINNYTIKYPSIKTKGLTTLNEVWISNNDRFSYTVNFGKYINKENGYKQDQNLFGLNKISFNNMLGDPTLMKEYLSYYLLTEMGIDTPEYALSNLYINNQYYGLYFMLEPIDESLSLRTLKQKNDFMFKIEANGGNLLYDERLNQYINENGDFDFSSIIYDKNNNLKYPKNNILSHYNGIWENDKDNFKKIAHMLPTFFKTLKKLNELSNLENKNTKYFEEELNKIVDVDKLIRYWAANIYLINSDSYISTVPVNYVIYMNNDGYITIIPWDYNFSFGAAQIKNTTEIINHNIYNPTINVTLEDRPLLNVILSNDNYKKTYEKYLQDAVIIATKGGTTSNNKTYPKNNFINMLDERKEEIINQQKKDFQTFYTSEEIDKAITNLKELITLRSIAVTNQLNNDYTKIQTNIKLYTLGGLDAVLNLKWNRQKYR